ncbi:uncharacterized protein VTP21DRAFT_9080 [Calcarisporiella thermophila]|uniref:uncharacterized protein n=1 Tax=Calcarisporiella thermophila TaxID=911321 RepID=UPI0037431DB0
MATAVSPTVSKEHLADAAKISEDWEDFLRAKYQEQSDYNGKSKQEFRDYSKASAEQPRVERFYCENHEKQTLEFVLSKKDEYTKLDKMEMGIWEAMEMLNNMVDESDPDTSLTQIEHSLQTAEAARKDGMPRWMQLTCLIHDLGKVLFFFGEPQWAVVGDTFPVGCAYSDKIVYPQWFTRNPDFHDSKLNSKFGIYQPHCGLHNVHMSFGHDEYLYHVTKNYLPEEALYIIRFHSFYAAHREGEYQHLMTEKDKEMLEWVKKFNPYDLYSKNESPPNVEELKPYYLELINEYFPEKIKW